MEIPMGRDREIPPTVYLRNPWAGHLAPHWRDFINAINPLQMQKNGIMPFRLNNRGFRVMEIPMVGIGRSLLQYIYGICRRGILPRIGAISLTL